MDCCCFINKVLLIKFCWLGVQTKHSLFPQHITLHHFYRQSIVTISLSCTVMEIWTPKYIQVTSLNFWGHVLSSVTWPFDSPCGVSYRWSMVTMRLSGTVIEIFSVEDTEVTTLTFWAHVTSLVTWPFYSTCGVSYRWSMVTMHLSCTVSEI